MGLLRSIESGIERVVDGTVGRVVRVSVQPVEIARKLAKELEDGKTVSGGRTFVPSQYTVYLPPKDRARFAEFEASLRVELGAYLAEHARREGYSTLTRPAVVFETANELSSGTFGIATGPEVAPAPDVRRVQAEPIPAESFEDEPPFLDEPPMFAPPTPPLAAEPAAEPELVEPELEGVPLELPVADASPWTPTVPSLPAVEPGFVPDPEPVAEAAEVAPPVEPEPEPVAEEPVAEEPAPELPAPELPAPSFGLPPAPAAPAPFLPVPVPPVPTPPVAPPPIPVSLPEPPPIPAPPIAPPREREPEPVGVTQSVSAAEAARAGLAHATDTLVVDGRRYTLTGNVTTIGRSSASDVTLDDASASRNHAELRRRGGKTVLVDLDSTNGTLVNGKRVREAPLRAGDRIMIGTTAIVFERAV
jgi:hypothetical protein